MSDNTCSTGEVYAKFTKQSGANYASEESYEVYSGSTLLASSPTFVNNELRETEVCLTVSTNNQYTLLLKDSYGDSWTTGSWLKVTGANGNVVFKVMMIASSQESYTLSLYNPIEKNAEWKMISGSVSGDWTIFSFADSAWTTVTLGSATTTVTGPQYFRRTFSGLTNMAAYEVDFLYQYGIVAYVNGVEIYRDNMPSGTVSASTVANGSYQTLEYHAILRPSSEVESAQSVLAVELHALSASAASSVDFNAFMALIAPTTSDANCYVYGDSVSLTASGGTNPSNAIDWTKGSYYYASSLPATLSLSFDGPRPFLNSMRVWPSTSTTTPPKTYALQGTDASSTSSASWSDVISVSGDSYTSSTYNSHQSFFRASLYKNYRLTLSEAVSTTYIYLYEAQFMVCNIVIPTSITFPSASYSFYKDYETVSITPSINGFYGCTVQPALPSGLTMDSDSCTVSGKASAVSSLTTYTVTSTMNSQSYTGTFSLQITECANSKIMIRRTYGTNAYYESFVITDETTQQVVLQVAYNSGQSNNADWESFLCLGNSKYDIAIASSINYWQSTSHLYVNSYLDSDNYETIARVRYDSYLGLSSSYTFNAKYAIAPESSWYVRNGEIPSDWTGAATSGWTQYAPASFPASTNQIQLYKTTFNVDSLTNVAGFVLSLKYKYACVVYLNGVEVFRNGVDGDLSASSYSDNIYTDVIFRQVSLPIRTIATDSVAAVNYLTTGSNRIAVAMIAANSAQTTAYFDCALRLMGSASSSRVFDLTTQYSTLNGSPTSIMNQYYGYTIYYSSCASNYFHITFNNDRREWVSKVTVYLYYNQGDQQPTQFVFQARNSGDSEWTTLRTVTGMAWSQIGEKKSIWIENNKPWNQYRLQNIASSASNCAWKLSTLDLTADDTTVTVPELSYASTTIYKDIEMAELYPTYMYYRDFTITPALPAGVTIDPNTGVISGTASAESATTVYSVTAKKYTGEATSATFSFGVEICTGTKGLITLVVRMDSWPSEGSYTVFSGTDTTATPVSQNSAFTVANGLNYADFCLDHNIYTLMLYDSLKDGWNNPAGYYITVDIGTMIVDMGQMPSGVASISTMFSSAIPFQIEYDTWKLYKQLDEVADDWNTVNFDDSAWSSVKAADFGTSEATTVYVRRAVTIPDIDKYYVLNVRVRYAGGIVAYFNGNQVARFNLEDGWDSSSESIEVHDATVFSKFHILLNMVSAVSGSSNVIAFEIHRPLEQASSVPIEFDATGVFGVNDCSIVVDSYSAITGTDPSEGELSGFLDLNPTTYGYQPNTVGTYLQWTVENLDGSRFNQFGVQNAVAVSSYGFSLYGRFDARETYTSMLALLSQSFTAMTRMAFDVESGVAGYTQFKFEVDAVASASVNVNSYMFLYCKATGTLCPAVDNYPAVSEGQISPGVCSRGYRGYSYRECSNGALGEVKTDKCVMKIPERLNYMFNRFMFVMDIQSASSAPRYANIITKFYLDTGVVLPAGLALDETTGVISGTPTVEQEEKEYKIYGSNDAGATSATVFIGVRKGRCEAQGNFPTTPVNQVAVYECSSQGSYVGSQKRACVLGAKDGEWQKINGYCMPVFMIVALVLVVIVIVMAVIFIVMRSRKVKAVGGVKSKTTKTAKTAAPKKRVEKKAGPKMVKVYSVSCDSQQTRHSKQLPGTRGTGITSRMFDTPVHSSTNRSSPSPQPACGVEP